MILSFEQPSSLDVVRFWNLIASRTVRGSGMHYTTGWIGAFYFWDQDGHAKYAQSNGNSVDGVAYPRLDLDKVPVSIATVPVKIDDNGVMYDCTFLAGSFGIRAVQFNEKDLAQGPAVGESRVKVQKGGAYGKKGHKEIDILGAASGASSEWDTNKVQKEIEALEATLDEPSEEDQDKVQKEIDALEAVLEASSDEDEEDGAASAEVAEPGALTMIQPLSGWLLYENDGTSSRPREVTPSRLREVVSSRRWRWWPWGTR